MQSQRLKKAESFIKDAELLFQNKRFDSCISRCYYAAYHAMVALLEKHGIRSTKWPHEFVLSEFGRQFIHKRKMFPRELAATVHDIYNERNEADYRTEQKSEKKAKRLLDKTKNLWNLIRKKVANENQKRA